MSLFRIWWADEALDQPPQISLEYLWNRLIKLVPWSSSAADICWLWLHSGPIYIWALRLNSARCNAVWNHPYCPQNWRYVRAAAVKCQPFSICHQTALLCNLYSGLKWTQHKIDLISRAAHQGSSTLSLMWTTTRNEPELEVLIPTGLASTELTARVLTMPSTGKHSLTELAAQFTEA